MIRNPIEFSYKIVLLNYCMKENEPVGKEFKEHLEEMQVTAKTCLIKFRVENSGILLVKAKITNLHLEPQGQEYIETDSGLFITLDKLISVDGLNRQY
jgi:hypothetical protein